MKPRFRRLAYAGAATVGTAVTAFVLAGGPSAHAEQCEGAVTQPLAVECVSEAQAGTAIEARSGVRLAETPNVASPPAEENEGGAVQPGASTGPEVPENQPVQPQASTPPEVPETTPPGEETTPPGQPQQPAESTPPGQPQQPEESTPPGQPQQPETGQNQPELPVTGRDEGAKAAGLGAGILAAGAALVVAARKRRRS
ncbi:LPXTG cell wall anchor domain-containing protein [Cryptosporangium japonicum]|uniref:Gram-positive cocci surface proteins LPxTG domain-containing protein n=1 Tax=Cryptosporangium japonicum TaxID=80872 RepID=A0ABN0V865_9ACTN